MEEKQDCVLCGKKDVNAICKKCNEALNGGANAYDLLRGNTPVPAYDDQEEMPSGWPLRLWVIALLGAVLLLVYLGLEA